MGTTETTSATVVERVTQDIAQFKPADAKLAKYNDYLTYTINGISDTDGARMVASARKEVKAERVALEHLRKAFVDDAVKYQAGINDEARRIRKQFEKIESHLADQEQRIKDEKERLARAESEALARKIEERRQRLYSMGMIFNGTHYVGGAESVAEHSVSALSDAEFDSLVTNCETAIKVAREKEEAAAAEAAAEAERAAEERRKLEEERAAIETKQREQEEEAQRVHKEQEERERKIREAAQALERSKIEAAELEARKLREIEEAKRREEERVAMEERIAKEREEAATAERIRIEQEAVERAKKEEEERLAHEAKMSDTGRLRAYGATLLSVPVPRMESAKGKKKMASLMTQLEQLATI